jgi:LPS-assembly protein
MTSGLLRIGWVTLWLSVLTGQAAQLLDAQWEIIPQRDGAFAYHPETNITVAYDGVLIRIKETQWGSASIQADRVTVDGESGELLAEGNIIMHQDGLVWRGQQLRYNARTQQVQTSSFRAGRPPFVMSSGPIESSSANATYTIRDLMVSTDDDQDPQLKAQVKRMELEGTQSMKMHGTTLQAGGLPVFYLPYLKSKKQGSSSGYHFTPGYRSRYGLFLLNEYDLAINESTTATFHLDYRTARGLAGGADFGYDMGQRSGQGQLQSYYMSDMESIVDPRPLSIGPRRELNQERYRFAWFHQAEIAPFLTAKASVQKLSDPLMNRDYFEAFHRQNTQPRSYVELNQQWSNAALSVLVQPQLNTFFNRIERLPEIKFTGLRQQLGSSPLYYESESSVGYFARQYRYQPELSLEAARLDSFHQILLPRTYMGWLNVTPKLGARYGYYANTFSQSQDLRETTRFVFSSGTEVSTKISRLNPSLNNRLLDLDGLRHVFIPSIQYVFVPEPNARATSLPQFDYEIPSLRILPIDFPAFNAIDAIDNRHVMRVGMRHLLQTRRGENKTVQEWVNWNLFADWRLDPEPDQGDLADLSSAIKLQPREWWYLQSMVRYSLDDSDLRVADQGITLLPNDHWSIQLGHMYVRDEPLYWGSGNNALYSRFYYRINDNWGVRLNQHYEARDGRLEEHAYTLYRDFRSFTGAFDLRLRNPRAGQENDITLSVVLSMKAFPQFGVGQDVNQASSFFDSK